MPLYEYRCKACGHRFEKIQTFSAPDEKVCPVCGSEVERLISAPAVHFSGSGFYSTDYKAKPPAAPRSSDGGSKDGGSATSSEGSKDSSPAPSGDSGAKSSSGSEGSSSSSAASSSTAASSPSTTSSPAKS